MPEVYKAKDTRLDHMVALKVLPQHLRDNPELNSVSSEWPRLSPPGDDIVVVQNWHEELKHLVPTR